MDTKERIQYATAVTMLVSGIVMSFVGFYAAPVGEISDSVLWYTAQTLIYAGSIFGVGLYIDGRLKRLENKRKFNLDDYQQ